MAKESIITYADFNPPALLGLAKSLRQISRSCQPSETPLAESLNWIVILAFEDGVEWIFRSPRKDSAVGDEYSNLLLESEAANLKYIKDNTTILVPDVFDSTASAQNPIGVSYILMRKSSETPLSDYHWPWFTGITHPKRPISQIKHHLSEIGKEKIMRQLGELAYQLSQLRLEKIGFDFEDDTGGYIVNGCLAPGFVWQ